MNIAVIPARGGSKRIPYKNILDFCGSPVIAYSINAALDSNLFDKVIVSTDDSKIKEVAIRHGAEVPFIRPDYLSTDNVPTAPVVAHAISLLNNLYKKTPQYVCCIYPCSPLISIEDLRSAYEKLIKTGEDFIYPVTEYPHPIFRAMTRSESGKLKFVFPEHELTPTQLLPNAYHDVGQFYWGKSSAWTSGSLMHTGGSSIVIPNWRVVDIDNLEDWKRAENIFKIISKI